MTLILRRLRWLWLVGLAGCAHASPPAPGCPAFSAADPSRQAAIASRLRVQPGLVAVEPPPLVCFARGQDRGVLLGEAAIVDPRHSDAELAAQLGHLAVHRADRIGDGCARGLAAALASEQRAVAVESQLRSALALPAAPAPAAALADYQRRCAKP